jgi:hypothetical protein
MKYFLLLLFVLPWFSMAPVPPTAKTNDEIRELRNRLAAMGAMEDDNQFLLEYWKFMAENHVSPIVRKGHWIPLGKAQLSVDAEGHPEIRDADNIATSVDSLQHYVLTDGRWMHAANRPLNATHFVLSTKSAVFIIDLLRQRVGIVDR